MNGRKPFIVTDALGLLLTTMVCSASVQDRDGAKPILLDLHLRTRVRFVYADAVFAGRLLEWATTNLRSTVEVGRKPPEQRGFAVLPRRWVVEWTLAWLTAHRKRCRLQKSAAHRSRMRRPRHTAPTPRSRNSPVNAFDRDSHDPASTGRPRVYFDSPGR